MFQAASSATKYGIKWDIFTLLFLQVPSLRRVRAVGGEGERKSMKRRKTARRQCNDILGNGKLKLNITVQLE